MCPSPAGLHSAMTSSFICSESRAISKQTGVHEHSGQSCQTLFHTDRSTTGGWLEQPANRVIRCRLANQRSLFRKNPCGSDQHQATFALPLNYLQRSHLCLLENRLNEQGSLKRRLKMNRVEVTKNSCREIC